MKIPTLEYRSIYTDKESLLNRMQKLGIRNPKISLGQNFLMSQSIAERIVKTCAQFSPKQVVEIGPGLGALTESLLTAENLVLIELDRDLAKYWQERVQSNGVLFGSHLVKNEDALRINWSESSFISPSLLVSNLPYQIAARLIIELTATGGVFDRMILMMQKEVAERMQAEPMTPSYGLPSIYIQMFWRLSRLADASPADFYPRPNVASRVLIFDKLPSTYTARERKRFLTYLKAAFGQRRKLLVNNLKGFLSNKEAPSDHIYKYLAENKLSAKARAEELKPQQHLELFQILEAL